MTEKEKNQLIVVGFMICFILIAILTAYTVINTKSIDKLIDKVEVLEGTRNTSAYSTEEGGNGGSGSSGEPLTQTSYSTDTFKAIKPSDIKKESKNKMG